ncbi:MAG: hypothetical protein ACAI38_03690 [Myxococcota bacterium]|nr:hypothetical protein [Myxococcota bacterium]
MADVVEVASSGRAKCRGCTKPIPKDDLRFGERVPNPFAEGEAELTYWFHVRCAAFRRCERFVTLTPEQLEGIPDAAVLKERAEFGVAHHRLPRIDGLERAKSGRAKCKQCKESIDAQVPRIVLAFWEEGRFGPMGFVHLNCAPAYFETPAIVPWLTHAAPEATADMASEIAAALA